MAILEAKNLYKEFSLSKKQRQNMKTDKKTIIAVNGLSLTLEKGEIYGLLGPNGAGKTTALRMISNLINPDKGEIYYLGADIKEKPEAYRTKVGFLTSELKLDDFFTPSYTFDFMARLYGIDENAIQERKNYLFDKFGVGKFKEVKIGNLSTGMKQKASLAISMAHDPDIVIFDEPTNGLDLVAAKDVEDFLANLRKEGKAVLISTHIFSLVEKLCDRIGIIINGKMAVEGKKDDLTRTETLEQLFFRLYREVGE